MRLSAIPCRRLPYLTRFSLPFFAVAILALLLAGEIKSGAQTSLLPSMSGFTYYDQQSDLHGTPTWNNSVTGPRDGPTFTTAWELDVATKPTTYGSVQLVGKTNVAVSAGDLVVLTFSYRRTDAYADTADYDFMANGDPYLINNPNGQIGETDMSVHFEDNTGWKASYVKLLRGRGEWRTISVPFVVAEADAAGSAQVDFQFGKQTQNIQIGGVTAIDYGPSKSFFGPNAVDETAAIGAVGVSPPTFTDTTITSGLPPQTTEAAFTSAQDFKMTASATSSFGLQGAIPTNHIQPQINDTLVAIFWMRDANSTTNFPFAMVEGLCYQNGVSTSKPYRHLSFQVDGTWKQFIIPFTLTSDNFTPGVSLNFGLDITFQSLEQEVQIGGFNLFDLGSGTNIPTAGDLTTSEFDYPGEDLVDSSDTQVAWRSTASTSINNYRKGTIQADVTTTTEAGGTPLPNVSVTTAMVQPLFGFGSAVDSATVTSSSAAGQPEYSEVMTSQLFNKVSTENNLKWLQWENAQNSSNYGRAMAVNGIQWFRNNGIFNIRGHNLVWPSWSNLPSDLSATGNSTDPAYLMARVTNGTYQGQNVSLNGEVAHIEDEAGYPGVKGYLREWDAVNEPFFNYSLLEAIEGNSNPNYVRTNSDWQNSTKCQNDANTIEEWLGSINSYDQAPAFFINENSVESTATNLYGDATVFNTNNPEEYYEYHLLQALQNEPSGSGGNLIDGYGFESHFQGTDSTENVQDPPTTSDAPLTPPLRLKQVFDEFGSGGLNLMEEATEFDQALYYYYPAGAGGTENPKLAGGYPDSPDTNKPVDLGDIQYMNDQAVQADYLTDYLTMVFSEPNFDSFVTWSFWDDENWPNHNAPIYNHDWSLKPSGLAFTTLAKKTWWNGSKSVTTDPNSNDPTYGDASFTGCFLGRYTLQASNGGITKIYHVSHTSANVPGTPTTVHLEVNGSAGSKNVWLYEAESAVLENFLPTQTTQVPVADSTAYGGYYMVGPTGGYTHWPGPGYTPDLRIDLDPSTPTGAGTTVYLWMRYKLPNGDTNTADFTPYYNENNMPSANPGTYAQASSSLFTADGNWHWTKTTLQTYSSLPSGKANDIGIVWNGAGLEIDQVLVTDDSAFHP